MRGFLCVFALLAGGCHAVMGPAYSVAGTTPAFTQAVIQLEQPRRSVTGSFYTWVNVELIGATEEHFVSVREGSRCDGILPEIMEYGNTYGNTSGNQFVAVRLYGRIEEVQGDRYIVTVHASDVPEAQVVLCSPIP